MPGCAETGTALAETPEDSEVSVLALNGAPSGLPAAEWGSEADFWSDGAFSMESPSGLKSATVATKPATKSRTIAPRENFLLFMIGSPGTEAP